ncbi:uncharacterized protein LOC131651382 [Vicia villosa]|uniref:uncharacterized protein LOC131651382 n=1 Tax=Vicia villosa TaxID=3911 RepID=UPI00273C382E|nr:uncharacterized protein LOC131651382 [Vicia villosa]
MNSTLFPMQKHSRLLCLSQWHKNWMLESNNQIFRIQILQAHDRIIAVSVYRFDSSQTMWKKVKSIKDRMFFVSSLDSSFSCQPINLKTEGGRIYIALNDNDFVYIYNIEDDSLMISRSFSNLPKNRSYSRWIMPNISITDTLKEENAKALQIREKENMCGVPSFFKKKKKKKNMSGAIHLQETEYKFALPIDIIDAEDKFGLPIDIVEVIAKHIVNVVDYLHFRAANRLFHLIDEMFTFVHPKHGLKYKYNINFPYVEFWNLMTDWEICCSKDGWILIVGETSNGCFFFNPFTKQVLSPSLRFSIWNTLCVGLSHNIEFPLYHISPALHNGLFYYLSIKGKLAVIEATRGEEPKWKELVEPQAPCTGFFDSFLVECNGSLLSVFECSYRKWVKVFKLNESTMRWIKVESLNNQMLFVGNHTSFSAVAKIPGMENKIYFTRFYDESIVFYCLETNKYHTFENEVVHFHHVKEHLNSCWIDPRWD